MYGMDNVDGVMTISAAINSEWDGVRGKEMERFPLPALWNRPP